MSSKGIVPVWLLASALGLQVEVGQGSTPLTLGIKGSGQKINLSWPSTMDVPPQGTVFPEYTVESSADLTHWEPIGGRVRGQAGVSGPLLNLSLDALPGLIFYRVAANSSAQTAQETGSGGVEVFGDGTQFSAELARLGLMSVGAFATNTPQPLYLPQISWDPTTAQFWTNFNSSGNLYDFRLNTNELAVFRTNGFVVSERLGSASFADAYYRIFNDDLPVFITVDSILQAWHRTYDSMLEELEELQLATLLYVQQSYTVPITCGYPAGFVEPRPEFWQRMTTLANLAANAVAALPLSGTISLPGRHANYPIRHNYNLGIIKAGQVAWLGCPGNWVCPCGPPGQRALTRNPNFSGAPANERTPLSAVTPT